MTVSHQRLSYDNPTFSPGLSSLNHDGSAANFHLTTVLKRSTNRDSDRPCQTI